MALDFNCILHKTLILLISFVANQDLI